MPERYAAEYGNYNYSAMGQSRGANLAKNNAVVLGNHIQWGKLCVTILDNICKKLGLGPRVCTWRNLLLWFLLIELSHTFSENLIVLVPLKAFLGLYHKTWWLTISILSVFTYFIEHNSNTTVLYTNETQGLHPGSLDSPSSFPAISVTFLTRSVCWLLNCGHNGT